MSFVFIRDYNTATSAELLRNHPCSSVTLLCFHISVTFGFVTWIITLVPSYHSCRLKLNPQHLWNVRLGSIPCKKNMH